MFIKRMPILLLAVLVGCGGSAQSTKTSAPGLATNASGLEFKQYKSDAGKFSVLFPGSPKEQILDVPSDLVSLKQHQIKVATSNDCLYMVAYTDYPNPPPAADVQKFIDSVQQAAVKGARVIAHGQRISNLI